MPASAASVLRIDPRWTGVDQVSEVLARVGSPDVTVGAKGTPAPRWTYMPAPGDPETTTMLHFNKGVLGDIDRKVAKK